MYKELLIIGRQKCIILFSLSHDILSCPIVLLFFYLLSWNLIYISYR